MKKILLATDFSPAARNAALYGIQLAIAVKADVILFSAYQVPRPFAALNVQISRFAVMEDTKKKLADEAGAVVEGHVTQLEIVCDEGTPHESILAIAKEKEVDLIVVGMKGTGNSLKRLFGSTATSLVNDLSIPVIIVPDSARFNVPKNILYASDVFLDTTITAINQIKWLTDVFRSKLFVVRVVKDSYEEVRETVNTPQNLRSELKELQATFSFPVNTNSTDGLTEFIAGQAVDLVMMLPRKHEWLERLLVKSETKDMAFHTHLPILMLPEAAGAAENMTVSEAAEEYGYNFE
jgi:nucleotide-binding universal stress UspA family protein